MSETNVASEAHAEAPIPVGDNSGGGGEELSLREIIARASRGEEIPAQDAPNEPAGTITRDADGRFTSTRAPEGGTEDPSSADKPTTTTEEPATPAIAPPQAWSAPDKEAFAKLPPEAQDIIRRREDQVAQAFQERAQPLKEYEAIRQVLEPFAVNYRVQGYTDVDAVRMWATVANELRRNAPNAIRELIKSHGLTPEQILGRTADPQPYQQPAPNDVAMQRLDRIEQHFAQEAQRREQAEQQRIVSRIETFAADPANKHFETVRKYMGALITAEPTLSMEDAYSSAIRAHPDVWKVVLAEENAAAEAKRQAEAKKTAEAARRAGVGLRGAPPVGAGGSAAGERSIRQEIEAAMAASR